MISDVSVESVETDICALVTRMMESSRESQRTGQVYAGPYLGELDVLLAEHAQQVEERAIAVIKARLWDWFDRAR